MIFRNSTPITTATTRSQDIGLTAWQVEIMTALNMDQGLMEIKGSRPSLETTWKRYITITKAISKVGEIDWDVGKAPADSEVIGVYVGKSAFYDQSRVLHHVRLHSDMIDWLERDLDVAGADDGTSLWGYFKTTYTLRDMEKWLERKQKEARADQKGKKKETVQHSQKGESSGKGKGKEGEEYSSTSPKKSHKKAGGKHK